MATLALTPLEEYLSTSYEPDADYVDGVVEDRAVGEWDQASWQQALQYWFLQHREWNVRVRPELRMQVSGTRYRVADVALVSRDQPIQQVPTLAPIAVFEVLSPEDRMSRVIPKLHDYVRMGVANVFIVDLHNVINRFVDGELHPLTDSLEPLHGSDAHLDVEAIKMFRDL